MLVFFYAKTSFPHPLQMFASLQKIPADTHGVDRGLVALAGKCGVLLAL